MLGIFYTLFDCFFLAKVFYTLAGFVVILYEVYFTLRIDPAEGMSCESMHVTITLRCSSIAIQNCYHLECDSPTFNLYLNY